MNSVVISPVRDKILVKSGLSLAVWRAAGTQFACFHKYGIPTACFLFGFIFFLPLLNPYWINFKLHKTATRIATLNKTTANQNF